MHFIATLLASLGILGSFVSGSYIGAVHQISLSGAAGNAAATVHFDIRNSGPQAALFSLQSDQTWLTAAAQDSTDMLLPGGYTADVTVSADTSKLQVGNYSGNISITARDIGTGEMYDSQGVAVSLAVTLLPVGNNGTGGSGVVTASPVASPAPSGTPQPATSPSSTLLPSPKAPAGTVKPSPTPKPTASVKPKATPKVSASIAPSASATPEPTIAPSESPSASAMPSDSPSDAPSDSPVATPAPAPSVSVQVGAFASFSNFFSGFANFFKGLFR